MHGLLPAIGRLLVASRPAAVPAGTSLPAYVCRFQFSLLETDILNTITEEHRPATVNPSRFVPRFGNSIPNPAAAAGFLDFSISAARSERRRAHPARYRA